MSGDDDQKKDDSAQPAEDIPEVDAELVTDEAAGGAEPFDEPAPSKTATPPRRSIISPGVLFFMGLVLVAVAAGAVWYFTAGQQPAPAIDKAASETPAAAPQIGPEPEETPGPKLANDDFSDAKPTAPSPAQPASSLEDSLAEVSTPTEAISNTDLLDAAKEAAVSDEANPDLKQTSAEDAPPPASFEVEGASPTSDATDAEILPSENSDPIIEEPSLDNQPTDKTEPTTVLDAIDQPIIDDSAINTDDSIHGAASTIDDDVIASLETALSDERQRATDLETAIQQARNELASTNEALMKTRASLDAAQTDIAALRAENDALKTAERQSPVAAGAVALNAILKAVDAGAPFAEELPALEEAAPDAMAVVVLGRYANDGAPTLSKIRNEFDAAARAGLATANRENANGVVERYGARIAGLFNIRPAAPQPGNAPSAVISRAEHAVDQGALSRAIDEIELLPPQAQEAMGDWVDLARQRAEIDAALHSLNTELADRATRPESL